MSYPNFVVFKVLEGLLDKLIKRESLSDLILIYQGKREQIFVRISEIVLYS